MCDAAVSQTEVTGGYVEDISLELTAAQAVPFLDGFDLLWGTGDCANDTVFGSVPAECRSRRALAVFVMGLVGIGMIRRRDVRHPPLGSSIARYIAERDTPA